MVVTENFPGLNNRNVAIVLGQWKSYAKEKGISLLFAITIIMNIIIRALIYLVQTYHDYFERTKQNLYKSKKVQMPKPELYVIYTGDRKNKPAEVSLSGEFFGGEDCCIDVKVDIRWERRRYHQPVCGIYQNIHLINADLELQYS